MYIHNVYTGKCYTMYINALKCIYPMYIDVTQCIIHNVYSCQYTLGIYIVLHFLATPIYIGWQYIHCGACGFCYPMYIVLLPNVYSAYTLGHAHIHWDTRIYIWWHKYTLGDMHVYTLCYNDKTHIHWVTLGIYIVVHFTNVRSCYTMYMTMFHNVYMLLGYIYIVLHWIYIVLHWTQYTLSIYIVLHYVCTLKYIAPHIHWVYTLYCMGIYIVLHWTQYTLSIYIVLHYVYTLEYIAPHIHWVYTLYCMGIYIVLHLIYTLHYIVRCYTMYIRCSTMYIPI